MWATDLVRRFSVRLSFVLVAAGLLNASRLNGAVISNYAFDGNPPSVAVTVAPPGSTFSNFTRTNLADESHPNAFRSTGFSTNSSLDDSQHEGFSVTASGAATLAFEALSFDHNRSGKGPETGVVRYSFDGFLTFAEELLWSISTANTNRVWDFTNFVLDPGETVEFRFYGYNADAGSGSKFFELDNVGFVERASVPAPPSAVLAGLGFFVGVGGYFLTRRRTGMAT